MIALHELLQAARAAAVPVCRDGATRLDHAAFRGRVAAMVALLRPQAAARYALCIDDPFDFACALFAVLACGKTPVLPAHAAPAYLAELAHAYDAVLRDADFAALAAASADAVTAWPIAAQAPLILFTSGSSGTPKAIPKTLAQFDAEVQTLERQWGAVLGDATVLASVPHHHIYGLLFRIFWPLAAGRAFDRRLCLEPLQLQARSAEDGASVLVSTPAQLSRWPALPGYASLAAAPRAVFSSGGPLAVSTAQEYAVAWGAAPLEIYGSTETGGIAWRRQTETDAWQVLPGVAVRSDAHGALEVCSPHLGHTAWHVCDDAVGFDAEGCFRLLGRLDRVAKLAGKRVSLPELESRLAQHPYVAQAAAVVLAGAARERIGAVVTLTEAGSAVLHTEGRVLLAKALRRHLAAYFEVVTLPRHWRFRLALPFDARGKLPAAALAAVFAARAEGVEVLAEARHGDAWRYELRVPPTLIHFAGHFPGLPILPGVVQIDWAVRLAAEQIAGVRQVAALERLKFLAPVLPGAQLSLTLQHDAVRRRVQFAYCAGAQQCASGVIAYREPA